MEKKIISLLLGLLMLSIPSFALLHKDVPAIQSSSAVSGSELSENEKKVLRFFSKFIAHSSLWTFLICKFGIV